MTRVLVVDDEPSIVRALRINLTAHRYEVVAAVDGASGLAAVARHHPDVVVDPGLPDMDGAEVIRGIRGWTATQIIVLSVGGQEGHKVAALDAGADDYVTKPFGMDEFLARLRAAVRRAMPASAEPVVCTTTSRSTLRPSGWSAPAAATCGWPPPSGSCWKRSSATAAAW